MLKVNHLSFEQVYRNVSFEIKPGEIFSLAGSRGSGKSTLLKTIAGLLKPTSGTITCEGRIALLFEGENCYPRMTVQENLHFFRELLDAPKDTINNLMETFSLNHLTRQKCTVLSPGEKRRVETAQALLGEPHILLADEIFGNIDRQSIFIIQEAIKEFADRGGLALLSTFGQKEVIEICDQLAYLEGGTLLTESRADQEKKTGPLSQRTWQRVPVRQGERTLLLEPARILYIQAGSGVELITREETFLVNFTLAELEENLKHLGFFRSHRCYLVNLEEIKEIMAWSKNSFELILKDSKNTRVPLSKHRVNTLKTALGI